jgi:hypothetical protein
MNNPEQEGATKMKRSLILAFMLILSPFFAESARAQLAAPQTVTAHGFGLIGGSSCIVSAGVCNSGGDGVAFHFFFKGTGVGPGVPVAGFFTAIDLETGVRLDYKGAGLVFPASHELQVQAPCNVTTPDGLTLLGPCNLLALDRTSRGATDILVISGSAANGSLAANLEPASGNITIDD